MKEGNDTFKAKFNNLDTFKKMNKEWYAVQAFDKDDRLAHIVLKQKLFQSNMIKNNTNYAMMDGLPYKQIQTNTLALMMEVAEIMDRLPWKAWKHYTDDEKIDVYQDLNIAEEVIDCLHFVINIWLALGFDADDLYVMFAVKHARNIERQQEGY